MKIRLRRPALDAIESRKPASSSECNQMILRVAKQMHKKRSEMRQRWLDANKPIEHDSSRWLRSDCLLSAEEQTKRWEMQLHIEIYNALAKDRDFVPDGNKCWRDYGAHVFSRNACGHVDRLAELAARGNPEAAEAFGALTLDLVSRLSAIATEHPELLRPFARRQTAWPVMKSPHRHLSQDEQAVFRSLEVARNEPRKIEVGAAWNPHDEAGQLALEIYSEIQRVRHCSRLFHEPSAWEWMARGLPPFSRDREVALRWFAVAKAYLEKEPQKLIPLNKRVPKSKRKRNGGVSSRVFTMIKDKLLSMAGCNKV